MLNNFRRIYPLAFALAGVGLVLAGVNKVYRATPVLVTGIPKHLGEINADLGKDVDATFTNPWPTEVIVVAQGSGCSVGVNRITIEPFSSKTITLHFSGIGARSGEIPLNASYQAVSPTGSQIARVVTAARIVRKK